MSSTNNSAVYVFGATSLKSSYITVLPSKSAYIPLKADSSSTFIVTFITSPGFTAVLSILIDFISGGVLSSAFAKTLIVGIIISDVLTNTGNKYLTLILFLPLSFIL